MGENTKIQWADYTHNDWIGCAKVSEACKNCYAEVSTVSRVFGVKWGVGAPRRRTKESTRMNPFKWDRKAKAEGVRFRVFCSSLSDWLDDEVPIEWLIDLLNTIRKTPNLDWMLLTKRIELFESRLTKALEQFATNSITLEMAELRVWIENMLRGWSGIRYCSAGRENYWIGTTVENQVAADFRLPALLQIPASVRFLSCEPLLGSVDLRDWLHEIQWVIVGGESGDKARPMRLEWARSLRDQCAQADVAFFFKQWGQWRPAASADDLDGEKLVVYLDGYAYVRGKKEANGRLLDGTEYSNWPETAPSLSR